MFSRQQKHKLHLTETPGDKTGPAALLEYSCGPDGRADPVQVQSPELSI